MGDFTRISTNIQAMQTLNTLQTINAKVGIRQLRLATGKKINSVGDDPAGYKLARGLESRARGLRVGLNNVANAQNILAVAEGGYQNIMDLLQTIKEKATQAADTSLSSSQRTALNDQVSSLITEIDDIVTQTTFNDDGLIDGGYSGYFQVGAGASDTLSVSLQDADSAALSIESVSITTTASASAAITTVETAIDSLSSKMQDVGEYQSRLASKESNLSVSIFNTDSVRSSIEDTDFAFEQMEIMKLQILQQTALLAFNQANLAPQAVLKLFK